MLPYRTQPTVVCVAQVKSTVKDLCSNLEIFFIDFFFFSRKLLVSLGQSTIVCVRKIFLENELWVFFHLEKSASFEISIVYFSGQIFVFFSD
jgi:hypothetical protein